MSKFSNMWFFVSLLAFMSALQADEASIKHYLELIRKYPNIIQPQGNANEGEIEILTDEKKMVSIEKKLGRDVGVVKQDKYWTWINDACKFPSGHEGVYGRIIWTHSLASALTGVAVVPITSDGKIVLNCNFRHATRNFEVELPRGLIDKGETAEQAAKREASEETGRVVAKMQLLGEIPPDTGVVDMIVPIYAARVIDTKIQDQEKTEAIEDIIELSVEEIKQAFARGYYECQLRGKWKKVFFRDPFLAYAILIMDFSN